ncbi:MAG TPA: hypothetical protein VH306_03715 [Gaiellaceae bacterium]
MLTLRGRLLGRLSMMLVGVGIIAVGCGGSTAELGEGVTTIAAETSVSDGGSGDWNRYRGKIFTVELPASWRAVGFDELPPGIAEAMPDELKAEIESGNFFYALDASSQALEAVASGRLAGSFSVNRVTQPPTSWKRFVQVNSQAPSNASAYDAKVVRLPVGRALEVTWRHAGPPLNQEVAVREYLLLPEPDQVIVVTMETAPDLFDQQAQLFDEVAHRLSAPD